MLTHPQIDPIAIAFGPIAIRWYGLMYLLAFGFFFFLGRYRANRDTWRGVSYELIDDQLFWGVLGTVLGGRLGYVLFYKPGFYFSNPLEALAIWHGGMSFHGGLLGVIAGMGWVGYRRGLRFFAIADFVAPLKIGRAHV